MIINCKTKETSYVFTEERDVDYVYEEFKDIDFETDFLRINNGVITVKGTNKEGYSWDGCSPKYSFWDIYVGTPDGVIGKRKKAKAYYASMVHDALYQFSDELREKTGITRKMVDRIFLEELKREEFRLARFYFLMVKVFGGLYWNKWMKRFKWLNYIFLLMLITIIFTFCELISYLVHQLSSLAF